MLENWKIIEEEVISLKMEQMNRTAREENAMIEEIYQAVLPGMIRYAVKHVRRIEDAEDIVGEVWIAIWLHRSAVIGMQESRRNSYIYTALRRKMIDYYRSGKDQMELWETEWFDQVESFERMEDEAENRVMIENLMTGLQDWERKVIDLGLDGYGADAIARKTGITKRQVYSCRAGAIRKMKKKMRCGT